MSVIVSKLQKFQKWFLYTGLLLMLVSFLGASWDRQEFIQSYLLGILFVVGIGMGSFALLMLHNVTGGAWGYFIRSFSLPISRTLPVLALLFVPVFFGLQDLYLWARPEAVAGDAILQHKSLYLNSTFFVIRSILYFLIWIGIAFLINKFFRENTESEDARKDTRLQLVSGLGLVLYGLTGTFASFDWGMSLDPHWFSTMYGLLFISGQVLSGLCFIIVWAFWIQKHLPSAEHQWIIKRFHDLGNLALAFVMMWAYLAFSQYLIIWSGNLPEEIMWYIHRQEGGWSILILFLIAFHFFTPFFLLLNRVVKRSVKVLALIAAALLVMRYLDLSWTILPTFHHSIGSLHWMNIVVPLAIGSIWVSVFIKELAKKITLDTKAPLKA